MICRAMLMKIETGSFSKNAIKYFFDNKEPVDKLTFSRSDFFKEGSKFVEGMSISGVQQKLSLILNKDNFFEIVSTNGSYILKPSPESFPYAAENEQCAMAISRFMGIETAYSANIQFSDGEEAYITKRYDRINGVKLHQEDLAQGFNLPSKDKYKKSYEEALELSRRMSGGKLSVVKDLFGRIVFAYLIGNDDMHLKNMSLIKTSNNKTQYYDSLTPNYDQLLIHAFPNPSKMKVLALNLLKEEDDGVFTNVYEKYGFYTGHDFYELGTRVGLRLPVIKRILNSYFQKEVEIIEIIKNSFMPNEMKIKAELLLKDRIKALKILK
jgi:serine/threonine-protein kinase HipA